MNSEKLKEIKGYCNSWFYGFDSEIKTHDDAVSIAFSGSITSGLCRINLAFVILEMIEDVGPSAIEMDFRKLEIIRDDFYELIIEVGLVAAESDFEYRIYLNNNQSNSRILRAYERIFTPINETNENEKWSIEKERAIREAGVLNLTKQAILDAWEGEMLVSTFSTEKPGADYKYHRTIV